jgi:thiamine pyrophosphate-dependent acetolactate synthase large subunit-like protein
VLTKEQFLKPLAGRRTDEVVVTTMGVVRPWGEYSDSDLDFASADSAMGHAADLALGVAMAQPSRRVICLNGDGSMLMSLGTLVTIVESGVENLLLFVVVNRSYEITGNQPIPGAASVDFCAMAEAAGFLHRYDIHDSAEYQARLDEILTAHGPVFVSARVEPGAERPISRSEGEPARYLRTSLADWSRTFRQALLAPR